MPPSSIPKARYCTFLNMIDMPHIPFLRRSFSELVGIEIGPVWLKLVLCRPGTREVAGLASREIKGLSDDDLVKAVAAAFKELGAKEPEAALIVPSPVVISKNIEVPSVDSRELREIINLQAARHTPFSREEIIVDYIEIGTFRQNYTKILLLIVTGAAIKKQIVALEKAGIRVGKVLLGQEGIGFFLSRAVKADSGVPSGFVHIDEGFTDFSIVLKNKVLFIRSVPIGAQQLAADREKAFPKFIEEIKKSLETYHAECIDKPPQGLYIAGALDGLGDLDLAISAETKLPVKPLAYWNLCQVMPSVKARTAAAAFSFFGVLAPLMTSSDCKVNLLPDEIRLKRSLQQRGMDLFIGGVLLLVVLVLLLFISVSKIYFKSEYLRSLESRYRSLSEDTRKLENTYQENSMIRSYLMSRGYSVKLLGELHELTPLNIELSDIRYDREGKFTIRGTADLMSTVFAYVDALEKSNYFKDVKTKYTTKRQEGKKDVTDFEINMTVTKAAE